MRPGNWILVPIDFSSHSRRALECADEEAGKTYSGIILLHVRKSAGLSRTRGTEESGAIEKWGRYVHHTARGDVAYLTCVGEPAEEILRVAQQYRPRAIIMGHGSGAEPGPVAVLVEKNFEGRVSLVCGPPLESTLAAAGAIGDDS